MLRKINHQLKIALGPRKSYRSMMFLNCDLLISEKEPYLIYMVEDLLALTTRITLIVYEK